LTIANFVLIFRTFCHPICPGDIPSLFAICAGGINGTAKTSGTTATGGGGGAD